MNSYYSDTLYPLQDKVLQAIDSLHTPFYLTGGTALSRCYFHHRYSDDLDLFVNREIKFPDWAEQVVARLSDTFKSEIILRSESYYSLLVDRILKVEMINDVAFREDKPQKMSIFSQVDSISNILSNKVSAIISRDEPKDVVDIWIISTNTPINWPQVFQAVGSKAAGIFPPEVARKLSEFPLDLLDLIKWVEDKHPDKQTFKRDLEGICEAILSGE